MAGGPPKKRLPTPQPPRDPHFYHEMREANLLVMLAMLAGHAGDVENDVDGRVKYVHFARKCCKLQHFSSQDGKQKKTKNKGKTNPKLNLDPYPFRWIQRETNRDASHFWGPPSLAHTHPQVRGRDVWTEARVRSSECERNQPEGS